jgi:hypothetical protein
LKPYTFIFFSCIKNKKKYHIISSYITQNVITYFWECRKILKIDL